MTGRQFYRVEFDRDAERELAALETRLRIRVVARIDALSSNPRPRGSKKLSGGEGLYRIRIGDYRLVYQVRDRELVILVIAVGHRREVYRR